MSRFITQDKNIIDAVKKFRAGKSLIRECEDYVKDAQSEIVIYMDHEGVEVMQAGNSLVQITRYESVRLDTTRLRRDYPELVSKYALPTESLRVTVKDA